MRRRRIGCRVGRRWNRQQVGDEGDVLGVLARHREQHAELGQLRRGRGAALEAGGVLDLPGDGEQGAVLVVGRAEILQGGVALPRQPRHQPGGDAGFADAGLAREQDHAPFAALGLLPAVQEQFDLLLAPDQRRGVGEGVQHLGAGIHRLAPQGARGLHGGGEAFRFDEAGFAELE